MTINSALGRARLACIIGALAVSACGGGTPSAAPASAPVTAAPQTFAPTPSPEPLPTPEVTPEVTPEATEAAVDPADDLEIAAPYTLEPLDQALADMFISSMEESMGGMAEIFHVGVRSAVKDGATAAWIIVMEFPDLPIGGTAILDGAAAGAAGEGGVEKRNILGTPTRIIESDGFVGVIAFIDGELIMVMAQGKPAAVGAMTAVITANA